MATVQQVTDEGASLRNALQVLIDDGDYTASDRDAFTTTHLVFSRQLSAFTANPGQGPSSPVYDDVLAAEQLGSAALGRCTPSDPATIYRAIAGVSEASATLASISQTVAATIVAGPPGNSGRPRPGMSKTTFASALAIRRSPVQEGVGDIGMAAAGTPDVSTTDPAESYLTSLAKLFPAEALTALPLALSMDEGKYPMQRAGLVTLIALASAGLRYLTSRDSQTGNPDILAVFVSFVSFLIYATAMLAFGPILGLDGPTTRIAAMVTAILWMGILTGFVRKTAAP